MLNAEQFVKWAASYVYGRRSLIPPTTLIRRRSAYWLNACALLHNIHVLFKEFVDTEDPEHVIV